MQQRRWRVRGRKAKRGQFRAFCEQIDAAEAILASKYLEAIERSILEKRVVTKERVRQLPDGSITREIIREHHPPNMGPAAASAKKAEPPGR